MKIVPVIDLMGGQAVHARPGARSQYRPLHTTLCTNSDPTAVVEKFLSIYPFGTIYIADLDTLMRSGDNALIIHRLIRRFPNVDFWIDQGLISPEQAEFAHWTPILGSESIHAQSLNVLSALYSHRDCILSLDFSEQGFIGPETLYKTCVYWPKRVIIMDLPSIGSRSGPNWWRLESLVNRWPAYHFIAGGGVRDQNDLQQMEHVGINTVLVASALHNTALDGTTIRQFMSQHRPEPDGPVLK